MQATFAARIGLVLSCLVALALIFAATPRDASAQVDGDLRAGVNVDAEVLTIGGGLLVDLSRRGGWYFNPNIEAGIDDESDSFSMSGDFHYDFAASHSASFYLGAGPTILMSDRDDDLGLNMLAGIAGTHGAVRPFAQMKGVVAGSGEVFLMGGVRF